MIELLSGLPDWMKVFVSAMVPVFELRFSIPFGVLGLKMSYGITYVISVLGSVVPAPFIMAFIPAILVWMRKTAPFKGLGNWVYNKGMSKRESIQKYGYIGLMFFVAIPLPGTGVWTGCLVASLLNMKWGKSVLAAIAGSSIAGIAVSILTSIGALAL
ncbi:small multi-drug export protein [Alkalibacter rhizosphaerae]|uniref:Small multi-drug export protein n=1 Tax=Alkalibacter rhizosphaerae TaxID=2815577 RepID=A0A974XDG4_9FIRM|nr:small multi-drug export protein [Alkalibacter rhizosphaerae]QSX07798.1 small multi-drug export protein [Alkalibacter rhizosphaerae]